MKILILIITLGVVACSTQTQQVVPPATSALASGKWKKVKSKPPTYFPKGVPNDHPTDYIHGYWIESGRADGTCFFVPTENTKWPRKDLIAEAQAAMTPQAKKELKTRQEQGRNKDAASKGMEVFSKTIWSVIKGVGTVFAGGGATM